MKRRGCLLFGIGWAVVFVLTLVGTGLGDRAPPSCEGCASPAHWSDHLMLIELAVLGVAAAIFAWLTVRESDDRAP